MPRRRSRPTPDVALANAARPESHAGEQVGAGRGRAGEWMGPGEGVVLGERGGGGGGGVREDWGVETRRVESGPRCGGKGSGERVDGTGGRRG